MTGFKKENESTQKTITRAGLRLNKALKEAYPTKYPVNIVRPTCKPIKNEIHQWPMCNNTISKKVIKKSVYQNRAGLCKKRKALQLVS